MTVDIAPDFVIIGSMKEKTTAMKANIDIMRKIAERLYSVITSIANNGEINTANPEDVVITTADHIIDLSPPASSPLNIVDGYINA